MLKFPIPPTFYLHFSVVLYLSSGWVCAVLYHGLGHGNKHCFLKALVNPSQHLSEKPHQPWIAVEKQCGTVVTATVRVWLGMFWFLKDTHCLLIDWEKCAHMMLQYSLR